MIIAVDKIGKTEDLAMALETGQLISQGSRGTYEANTAQIAEHFGLQGPFVPMAMARLQRRWAVATWIRLGEAQLERTAQLVLKFGLLWVTNKDFGGAKAVVHVAVRWVLQGRPCLATLQYA